MNRQEKEAVVVSLKEAFNKSNASFLVGVNGLTVEQIEGLRKELRTQGAQLRVAKVRLMKRALEDTQYAQGLEPLLREQIALVFAQQEGPAVAKVLCGFAKRNERFSVVAGCMDSAVLDKKSVMEIASLPSREVLLAHLAATLNAPIVKLAVVIQQILEKREKPHEKAAEESVAQEPVLDSQ